MFTIAGILADEEPKTATSPSGNYDTAGIDSTYYEYDDYLLESLSAFTIMAWVRFDVGGGTNNMTIYGGLYDNLGSAYTGAFSFQGENGADRIDFSVMSSASTVLNVFDTNTNLAEDTWYHLCATGSVADNELKLFLDGQLIKTAVMPYSIGVPWNATTAKSYTRGVVPFDMAQFNVFDRRLTESEVLEHYVYDDDLMFAGVLGWDAMTPAQRSGLIYSSSFTKDISISGNEFNDKSGNGITISPQPSLTGEQIYFYTNASDLPSDTQIYPLSTLNVAGAGSVYTSNSSFSMADLKANGFSWMFYVDFSDAGKQVRLGAIRGDSDAITVSDFTILKLAGGDIIYVEAYNGSSYSQWAQSGTAVSGNGLTHVALSYTGTSGTNTLKLYIDGVEESSVGAPSWTVGEGGRISHGGADFGGGSFTEAPTGTFGTPFLFDRAITQAEILSISSGGTSLCYDLVDNTAGLKDAIIYAPTLGEYNGSSGQALIDPASGITTNESGTVTYDGTGVSVECTS